MTDIDFVRDGRVGDKVHDPRYGNGLIAELNEGRNQSVWVRFENRSPLEKYYATGLWTNAHVSPLLCWGYREPLDQGHPPKRFDYPLCMKAKETGIIVEFIGLQTGTLLKASKESDRVGTTSDYWHEHTNTKHWTPCDRPVWNPTKPTWCYINGSSRVRLIYTGSARGMYVDSQGCRWTKAEPCEQKDIPDWWPKEWA